MAAKRRHILVAISVLLIVGVFVTACASLPSWGIGRASIDSERVDEIVGKLILVSLKAENKIRRTGQGLTSETLKADLVKSNPVLLRYFDDLSLEFEVQGRHVIALVCDKAKTYAVAEDSACTAAVDRKDATGKKPCAFTLQSARICTHQ